MPRRPGASTSPGRPWTDWTAPRSARRRAPGPQPLPHAGVHLVDSGSGPTQHLGLSWGLADPQRVEHLPVEFLPGVGQHGAEGGGLLGPHVMLHRDPHRAAGKAGGDESVRGLGPAPAGDLDTEAPGRGGVRLGPLQLRYYEEGFVGSGQDEAGETLQGLGVVSGRNHPARRSPRVAHALRGGDAGPARPPAPTVAVLPLLSAYARPGEPGPWGSVAVPYPRSHQGSSVSASRI